MEVVASLSQGRTAASQCGLFTHKSVPVMFEPPCTYPPFPSYLPTYLNSCLPVCLSFLACVSVSSSVHIFIQLPIYLSVEVASIWKESL